MSGSEPGLMAASRESSMPFPMALHHQQQHEAPPQQQSQNMQLSFNESERTELYKHMRPASPPPPPQYHQPNPAGSDPNLNMNIPGAMTESEPVKRKRGRPRKYGPDSGAMSLALVPGAPSFTVSQPSSGGGSGGGGEKKMRGRPPGSSSKKHKLQALGSTGVGFTPHVLTVSTGEDVSSKIMALTHNGPRAVCVLSANGAISSVALRQADMSGGTVTYEGRFEILSLSGSFHLLENNGHRIRTGGLSISLSSPDGTVLGGGVAGLLIAASPVQIVVGSFIPDGQKEPKQHVGQMELSSPPIPRVAPSQVLMAPSSPQSRVTMSESSCGGGHGSPLHQSTGGPYNNTNLTMPWK